MLSTSINNSTTIKTIILNFQDLIKYQKALAAMNGIQLTTWQALKAGISSTTKAMVAWMATNPIGWFTLLAGATVGTALVLKQFNTTLDDAGKTLSEQNEKFKSLSDEVTSLSDELETATKRIEELEALPSLTIVEDEELQKLKDTTAELEYQLAIKKEEQRIEAEKTAKAANDAYNASYQRMYDGNGELITSPTNENWNPVQELKNTMKAYEVYKKSYDELQAKITQDSESGEDTSKDQKRLANIKKQMTSIEEHAKEMADVINDQKEAYEGLYAAGFDVQGNDLAIYEEVRGGTEAYREFCNTLNDTTKAYSELSNEEKRQSILSKAVLGGKTKEEAQKIVDSISDEDLEFVGQIHFNRDSTIQSVHDEINTIKSELNKNLNTDETSIPSIIDSWNSLIDTDVEELKNTRKDLLALAEAGQLTAETFHDTTGADTFLDGISETLPEVIDWINQLVSSSTQLQSMSAQISKISDMLADKKNGTTASASDLAGFDATVKGLESWEEFERVMGSSKSSMEECQKAADALATEWVNNGNFLANLTEENKDYYTHQLKSMGIENAAAVVTEALAGKKEALRLKYLALNAVLTDFEGKTNGACARLLEQENASDQTRQALADLVSQEILFNNSSLDVSGKISALNQLALAAYGVSEALNSGMGLDSRYYNGKTAEERIAEKWSIMSSAQKVASSQISISPNGSSNYKTKGSKDNKQTIDWISRLLDVLQKKIDATKAKFENLFTLKDKKNNLAKQLTLTKNLLTATTTAANRYKKAADKVNLSSDLKKKVRNGSYDINEYDSKTAEKIQKYENFYDQYKELLQKADELTTDIRNLQIEQYQLVVDNAEAKIARSQARAELDAGNYKEQNKHLEYQKKYLKEQYEAEIEIAKVKKDKVEVARLEAELQKELNDLTMQEFENIDATYSMKVGFTDNKIQAFQDQISLLEARGEKVGSALYTKQVKLNQVNINRLQKERQDQIAELDKFDFGTAEWYKAQDAVFATERAIKSYEIEQANLQKSINQLKFDRFDDLLAKLNDIVDETDFLIDMLDSDNFYDDNGKITDDGITAMGMYAQKRDVYKVESEKYKQMQAELDQMYANGDIGIVDYEDLSRKYKQGQMDMAKAAEDMNKSIINLVSDGLEKQNQALSESIQKQKDLLRAEKDLKSFQDSLSDANKNVSRLERQYEILSGDDSEENRKRLREIKSQLEDAKKSRDDLLYDKSIEDQEKNLDDMYNAAVKSSEEYLKDSTKVLIDACGIVNANTETVSKNIERISKETGVDISENITNAWNGAGNAVSAFGTTISSTTPGIISQISLITEQMTRLAEEAEKASQALVNATESKNGGYGAYTGVGADGGNNNDSDEKLKADVVQYIDRHLNKGKHDQNYYGSLNQYIYGLTGGKILSVSEQVELAKLLGVSVKSDLSGKNDKDNILKALKKLGWGIDGVPGIIDFKSIGFSTGGFVNVKDAIRYSGEDGMALVRNDEYILSPKQTDGFLTLAEHAPQLAESLKNMNVPQWNYPQIDRNIPIRNNASQSPVYNIDNRVIVEGVATDKIVKDFENVAKKQTENAIAEINRRTYAKGVRTR